VPPLWQLAATGARCVLAQSPKHLESPAYCCMKSHVTGEARALAQALLNHHRQVCRSFSGSQPNLESFLIPYGSLCELAKVPHIKRIVGQFLREVAAWCHDNGWPPINALAVNRDRRMPGDGYDGASGCHLELWPDEVTACIRFKGYPDVVS
jgi:hypothetical protein